MDTKASGVATFRDLKPGLYCVSPMDNLWHDNQNVLSVMLRGEQTGNMISIMWETTPPGGGPPLHAHSREEELDHYTPVGL